MYPLVLDVTPVDIIDVLSFIPVIPESELEITTFFLSSIVAPLWMSFYGTGLRRELGLTTAYT